MAVSIEIQGFKEAQAVLADLPDKFQAKVIRTIFNKAAKPLIAEARSRLLQHDPNYKNLADAIGTIPVRTNDPIVVVGIRAKGKYKDSGYIGHWVEYGVSGVKLKTSRTLTKPEDESYRIWVAKVPEGGRYRNDIPPQPFMRPAIDAKTGSIRTEVNAAFGDHLYRETEKALARTKGLSASAYAKAKGRI